MLGNQAMGTAIRRAAPFLIALGASFGLALSARAQADHEFLWSKATPADHAKNGIDFYGRKGDDLPAERDRVYLAFRNRYPVRASFDLSGDLQIGASTRIHFVRRNVVMEPSSVVESPDLSIALGDKTPPAAAESARWKALDITFANLVITRLSLSNEDDPTGALRPFYPRPARTPSLPAQTDSAGVTAHSIPPNGGDSHYRAVVYTASDPDRAYNDGVIAFGAAHYDLAIAAFQRALQLRPNFTDANFNLGLCFETVNDWEPALDEFKIVVSKHPKLYDAWVEMGTVYLAQKNAAQAEACARAAQALKPSGPEAKKLLQSIDAQTGGV